MIVSLETAAHEAAIEDGVLTNYNGNKNDDAFKSKKAGLRRGKWTTEEESYANRLIYEFKLGLLPLTDGTTLRTFLSKLLNCDPMRISKKFVGQNCIGKQVFRRRQQDLEKLTVDQVERSRKELSELERRFLERVAQTNRTRTAPKEGRMAGYDDEGGLAPWMIQPDDEQIDRDLSSSYPSNMIYQKPLVPYQNGYQNFDDYSNTNQSCPKPNEGVLNSFSNGTSSSSKDSMVKIKAGKVTASLYNGDKMQIYTDNAKLNNRFNDHYFDATQIKLSNVINPSLTIKNENQLDTNRENPLEILCNSDIVKFPPQVSENTTNFTLPNSSQISTTFPWYGGTNHNASSTDHTISSHINNIYNNNIQNSASSISLSDFAMSLWPSMNNLVTAAEALSNSQILSDQNPYNNSNNNNNNNDKFKSSDEFPKIVSTNTNNTLGSLTKLQSLSNVALDELEALEVEKLKTNRPSVASSSSKSKTDIPSTSSKLQQEAKVHSSIKSPNVIVPTNSLIHSKRNIIKPEATKNNSSNEIKLSQNIHITGGGMSTVTTNRLPEQYTLNIQSTPLPNQLRQNSSVENFWMLVNMGDLPQPEHDVLSETLWPTTSQNRTDGDDNTIKSLQSQNSRASKKRIISQTTNVNGTIDDLKTDESKLSNFKKSTQTVFKNDHFTNASDNLQINDQVVNQLPFSSIKNQNLSYNALLNTVKLSTAASVVNTTTENGAIFSSQLQNIYFPSNNNETSKILNS